MNTFLKLITEVTSKSYFFFQSPNVYEIGDVVSAKTVQKDSPIEVALEKYRKDKCSSLPSRKKSLKCSLVQPEFNKDLKTYIVKPIGEIHKTSKTYVDELISNWKDVSQVDRLSLEMYWNPPRSIFIDQSPENIEILCHSVQIIAISNGKRIKDGSKYEVSSEITIPGWNPKVSHKKFQRKDTGLLQKEFDKFVKGLKNVEIKDNQNGEFDLILKPGAKIVVNFIRYKKVDEKGFVWKMDPIGVDFLDISIVGSDNFWIDVTRHLDSFKIMNFLNNLRPTK